MGRNTNMGNTKVESNGNGEGGLENRELAETMRSLKMEVLNYKVDNE